jgi:hypothetical protein
MAANKNIFIKIDVSSKKAKKDVDDVEKGVNKLAAAEKKLAYEQSQEAKELAKLNLKIKEHREANNLAAKSADNLGNSTKQAKTQVGLNNAILTEAGRAASDLRFGFNGVANNVGQLASLFGSLIQTSDSVGTSLRNLLKSLMGTGGILIAIQLIIAYGDQIYNFFLGIDEGAEKAKKSIEEATKAMEEQIRVAQNLAGTNGSPFDFFAPDDDVIKNVERLKDRFADFKNGYDKLDESSKINRVSLGLLIDDYFNYQRQQKELIRIEQELKTVQEQDPDKRGGGLKRLKQLERLKKELRDQTDLVMKLRPQWEALNEEPLFEPNLMIKFDKGEWKENKELVLEETIEFIDDVDEAAGIYALGKGKESLLSKIFKLSPKTREAELQKLKDDTLKFGETALLETIAYRDAVQAVNDKYDLAERKAKVKHLQTMLGGLSDFLKSAADIADGNKDIARASIIASAAASSVGVWEAWLVKDPTFTPAPLKVAGAIATQLAIVASTVSALKSLNTNTPISSGGAGGGATIQAPDFNVVGASGTNQLAQAVGGQVNQPIRAFVVGSDVTNQQELDRRIVDTAGIG